MAQRRLNVVLDLDTGRYSGRMNDASAKMKVFQGRVDAASPSVRRLGQSFNSLNSTMSTPLQKLRDYVLILGNIRLAILNVRDIAVGWVGSLLQQSMQVERLTILMKGLSTAMGDAAQSREASQNLQMLFQMARETGFAVDSLANAFVKFRAGGLDPTDGSLRALTNAVAQSGGTSDVMHRASIAIQQMAGKGVISMEELRQQLGEAVPSAMRDMARAAGMTMPDFVNQVSKGAVKAGPALRLMFLEFDRLYAGAGERMANTLTGQMGQFRTNVMELATYFTGLAQGTSQEWQGYVAEQQRLLDEGKITVEEFDSLTSNEGGLFRGAADAMRQINEMMQSDGARQFASGVGSSINQIAAAFMQFATAASGNGNIILQIFQALADVVSITLDVMSKIATVMSSLSGPIGIALQTIVAGFLAVRTANIFAWMVSGIGSAVAGMRGMATASATTSIAAVKGFNDMTAAVTRNAAAMRTKIALQNGYAAVIAREVTQTQGAVLATNQKIASLQSEQAALTAKIAAERSAIVVARQAQVVANANIATNTRLSASIQQSRAAKTAETLATIRLGAAERALAATKGQLTLATNAQTAAVTAETAALARSATAKGAATVAQRALTGAITIGATATRAFAVVMNFALGPIGLIASALLYAAWAAGVFESAADKATAAAERMRNGMAEAGDAQVVASQIGTVTDEIARLERKVREGGEWMDGLIPGTRRFVRTTEAGISRIEQRLTRLRSQRASFQNDAARGEGFTRQQRSSDAVSSVRSDYDLTRAANAQNERAELAALQQQYGDTAEFQKRASSLRERTQAQNIAYLQARVNATQRGRDNLSARGGDTSTYDLTLLDLNKMLDSARAATTEVDGLREGLSMTGTAGSAAGKKTARGMSEAEQAAQAAARAFEAAREKYENITGNNSGDIAQLESEISGAEGALAEFNARVSAGLFKDALPEEIEALRLQYARIDELTEERDWGRGLRQLRKEVVQAGAALRGLAGAMMADDIGQAFSQFERVESVRARFADKLEEAAGNPERLAEVNGEIEQMIAYLNGIDAIRAAEGWRQTTEQIQISLMNENDARQRNFDMEMERERQLMEERINNAALAEEEKSRIRARYDALYAARQAQLQRDNQSSTTRMARDWAKLGQNIDQALGGALNNFVDGMFDAQFNFGDFAVSIIKDLLKVIIKAMIAYAILSAIGMANNSSGQPISFGDFVKGQVGAGFGGQGNQSSSFNIGNPAAVAAPTGHAGAIIGRIHSGMAGVNPAVFDGARRYHSGTNSIGGRPLRSGEVPFIGLEGEAVLTEEHQGMIRGALTRKGEVEVPPVTVNVINNSGTQLEAEQGDPQFDGKEMIVTVVVDAMNRQGPLRDAMKNMSNS